MVDYRRSAERVTTSLLGLMDFGDSVSTCLVTDMSEGGARLRVSPTKPLPAHFQLRLSRAGTTHIADLRWRSGEEVGVEFRAADLFRFPQAGSQSLAKSSRCTSPIEDPFGRNE